MGAGIARGIPAGLAAVNAAYKDNGILAQQIATLAPGGWFDTQAKRIAALVVDANGDPICTGVVCDHLGRNTGALPTGAAQAPRVGGGWRITSGGETGNLVYLSKQTVLQDLTAGSFALAWRGSFNAPEGPIGDYNLGWVGLGGEDANGYGIYAAEYYGDDGVTYGSYTNMVLIVSNAGGVATNIVSSVPVDANALHDWLLAYNKELGVITLQRDGFAIVSTTTLTRLLAAPTHIFGRGNSDHYVDVTQWLFAYEEG